MLKIFIYNPYNIHKIIDPEVSAAQLFAAKNTRKFQHHAAGILAGGLSYLLLNGHPKQPASLIHGDLWGGNAMAGPQGEPAIIDPAAHYGWAEAELAMTTLFGAFPKNFYSAYQAVRPLAPGFTERFDLYNLYHLLNHLNLFGAGYLSQVTSVLRRYR